MIELTMACLIRTFLKAKDLNMDYVAVCISMEGFPKDEVIINSFENIPAKLEYYMKTYDENLVHKFAPGIKITGFTFGNDWHGIHNDLI